jgi:hypothetical protein
MGLEEQLIKGAYDAAKTYDSGKWDAIDKFSETLQEQLKGAHTRLAAQKEKQELDKEAKAKEDKIKKEALDKDFNISKDKILEAGGSLDVETYDAAFGHVAELKKEHDACANNDEQCRGRVKIKLNNYSNQIDGLKEGINGLIGSTEKDKNGRSKISESQTNKQKEILSQVLKPENRVYGGVNDVKLAELATQLKDAEGEDKVNLQKEIKELENSNTQEWGFNVSYTDVKGDVINERLSVDDLNNLVPIRRDDFSTDAIPVIKLQGEAGAAFKGGTGGGYDPDAFLAGMEDKVTEDNISSIYYDDLLKLGKKNTLKEQLRTSPMIAGLTYKELGLDPSTIEGKDGDGIIDEDEMVFLVEADQEKILDALSNTDNPNYDFERSKDVALDWMTRKSEQEFNKTAYGNPNITEEEKKERHTPKDGENMPTFLKRGGVLGALNDAHLEFDEASQTWRKKQGSTVEDYLGPE